MPVHNIVVAAGNVPGAGNPGALMHIGLVLPVEVHVPPIVAQAITQAGKALPAPIVGLALVDTGATFTAVHEQVLQGLQLNPVGQINCGTAAGASQRYQYPVKLNFPAHGIEFDLAAVTGVDLSGTQVPIMPPQPMYVLLGRDLLQHMVLVWNGPAGMCTIAI